VARTVARDHDEKAALILAAAAGAFAEQGYERATMAGIASAAGFSKASAYHYFASKEAVLSALLHRCIYELIGAVEQADPGAGVAPAERLACLIEAYVRAFIPRVFVFTPLLLDRSQLRPAWRESLRRLERQLLDRFAGAAGAAATPLPPQVTAFLLFGAVNWTYYWYDPAGSVPVDELARGAAALLTGRMASQVDTKEKIFKKQQ